jgi:hypothetical protein
MRCIPINVSCNDEGNDAGCGVVTKKYVVHETAMVKPTDAQDTSPVRSDVTEVTHLPRQDPLPIKQKLQVEVLPVTVVAPEVTVARAGEIYEGAYKRWCTLD